ncbi:hypothetical protein M433DRAFT_157172 [Acidomyces richmondensis BFW]|nr:MAG: hypothetical protein FE78DRAFT_94322 [Acidomyces sp. 'richmondensis']KYG43059.1 hypothetical protein M433DRAFT_157172 [Acidomyces richmondensis BFW]
MTQFHWEAHTKFGIDRVVTSRVGDLFVEEVTRPFEVREYDGSEAVVDVSRRRNIVIGPPSNDGAIASAHASASMPTQPAPPVPATSTSRDGTSATTSGKRPSNVGISMDSPAKASTSTTPAPGPASASVATQNGPAATAAAVAAAAASSKTSTTSTDAGMNPTVPPKPTATPANNAASRKGATVDGSGKPVALPTVVPPISPPTNRDAAPVSVTSEAAATKMGSGKSAVRTLSSKAGGNLTRTPSQAPPAGRGSASAAPSSAAPAIAKIGK